MAKVAWIIGNGPSRKGIDLKELEGTTFGCNALYRDFTPDYLVSGDAGVIKEICASGYPKNNKCIFPDWSPIPIDYKESLLEEFRHGDYEIYDDNPNAYHYVQIFGDENKESKQVHVVGCDPLWKIESMTGPKEDPEFSVNFFCGSNALAHACYKGFDKINLLGFDSVWNFVEDTYQNIYAGTDNYGRKKETSRLRIGTDEPNTMAGTQEAQIKKVLDKFAKCDYHIYKGKEKSLLTYDSFIK
jgi:hypothetical protein